MSNRSNNKLTLKVLSFIMSALTVIPTMSVLSSAADPLPVAEIYVSTDGNDGAEGTQDKPLASLEAARDAVRALPRSDYSGARVIIRGGEYYRSETFCLSAEDGGSRDFTVSYEAYEGETPVFTGAVTLDNSKFIAPDGDFVSLLPDESKDKVLAYDLSADGIDYSRFDRKGVHNAVLPDNRVYVGDERCFQARYPNFDKDTSRSNYIYATETNNDAGAGKYSFLDLSERAATWSESSLRNARLYGFFPIDWIQSSALVTGIDPDTGYVTYTPTNGEYGIVTRNARYSFYNVPEELDVPMEYYIDRETGMLYIYLPDGWEEQGVTIGQSMCTSMVDSKASYVSFSGLTFRGTMLDAFKVDADHVTMSNCRIMCIGRNAVTATGNSITIDGCDIYSIGSYGILMNSRHYEKRMNILSDNLISNCSVHEFEQIDRIYNPGLSIQGIGMRILNCHVYDAPHCGVSYDGTHMEVAYSILENLCYDSSDAGALYVYNATLKSGGTRVHDNIVRNIVNDENPYYGPNGIYIDAGSGGVAIYSNIIENVDSFGILSGGPDNELRDNLFLNARYEFHGGSYYRILTEHTAWNGHMENGTVATYPEGMHWQYLLSEAENPGYGTKAWAYLNAWVMVLKTTNCYDLEDHFVAYAYGDARIRNNVFVTTMQNELSKTVARLITVRDNVNLRLEQVGLRNYEEGDYSLTEDSKIYRAIPGFDYCDVDRVGVGK